MDRNMLLCLVALGPNYWAIVVAQEKIMLEEHLATIITRNRDIDINIGHTGCSIPDGEGYWFVIVHIFIAVAIDVECHIGTITNIGR